MTERLRVRGATLTYGPEAGIFGIDLAIEAGQVHALVGLNGAGKTTLMRTALGMSPLTSGSIHVEGVPLADLPTDAWRHVGHLVEHPFAYPELDVRTNLDLALRLNTPGTSTTSGAAGGAATVGRALEELELGRYAGVLARRLSQGNRQRLGLAAALQHQPTLIVLDEPTNSLDPAGVIALREALLRRAGAGAGVLVSSHHLDEVARIADQITVMNRGQIIGDLTPGAPDLERAFFDLVRADDESRTR